jgi:hypothetical protein
VPYIQPIVFVFVQLNPVSRSRPLCKQMDTTVTRRGKEATTMVETREMLHNTPEDVDNGSEEVEGEELAGILECTLCLQLLCRPVTTTCGWFAHFPSHFHATSPQPPSL